MESVKFASEKQLKRRRKHKNSKLGCPNCKKRRVKCSENLPSCINCLKHKVRCGYLDYTEKQLKELRNLLEQNEIEEAMDKATGYPSEVGSMDSSIQVNLSSEIANPDSTDLNCSSSNSFTAKDGISDVLNFQQSSITQIFDNLLSASSSDTSPIIYPLYTFSNTAITSPEHHLAPYLSFSSSKNTVDDDTPRKINNLESRKIDLSEDRALPGALKVVVTFKTISEPFQDYNVLLFDLIMRSKNSILNGTTSLNEIRYIFYTWLHSFFDQSYINDIMFSCLINLTTNYLISVTSNFQHTNFLDLIGKTIRKNNLLVTSIMHYAKVIKGLRTLLNCNSDPQLCASISYILGLMSIYDPKATLNSLICFRDGLFSVLHYNLNICKNNSFQDTLLNTVHLKLMTNVVRSVYFPGYDASFLIDFRSTLENFGRLIKSVSIENNEYVVDLIQNKYDELLLFLNETINFFVPTINGSLSDLETQQSTLFEMLYKCVRLYPPKLVVVNSSYDPLEKIMFLFFKAFTKALYSIFPQIKFFFLRDFESPLMLDYIETDLFEIFETQIETPSKCCLPENDYDLIKVQLKEITGYLVRMISFFSLRITKLYKIIVYEANTEGSFSIDDQAKWRNAIEDIYQIRQDFMNAVGFSEVAIKSFSTTIIKPHHYPQMDKFADEDFNIDLNPVNPNFLTLRDNGFLEADNSE